MRDGPYLLRTNLAAEDPAVLRDRYLQLVQADPHQPEHRVDAHILFGVLPHGDSETSFADICTWN